MRYPQPSLRDGLRVIAVIGAPPESEYPYDTSRFAIPPPLSAYRHAHPHRALRYRRVPQNTSILSAIYLGYPVIFGFSVYDYFGSSEFLTDNILRVPKPTENLLGGHAVLACGYRTMPDQTIQFLVRNSWGSEWGDNGYFWMEYAYIMDPNLASDFWVIETVSEAPATVSLPREDPNDFLFQEESDPEDQ